MPTDKQFIEFKKEIHDELNDFKEDFREQVKVFIEYSENSIKEKGNSLNIISKIILAVLASILIFTVTNTVKISNIKSEYYYTKKQVELTIMYTYLNDLKQSKINAILKNDTCRIRKFDDKIEKCKDEIRKCGFYLTEITRGVEIGGNNDE